MPDPSNGPPHPHDALFQKAIRVPSNAASVLATALPLQVSAGLEQGRADTLRRLLTR
ncbi:hypothetical protein [Pseudactinotalea sp.]|uniref:hypothetical protein n=1 Tax=Pseudactinotalea sp. TaxID=1926260 RepID=UPI003B3A11C2